jgi:hypothetical protein
MTDAPRRGVASHPGGLTLSFRKLFACEPQLSSWWRWKWHELVHGTGEIRDRHEYFERYADHLNIGDAQAAVVLRVTPTVLVAVYSEDLDCALLLRYPPWVVTTHDLAPGAHLLSISTFYRIQRGLSPDLRPGPGATGTWGNFVPLIAEFVSDDSARIAARKAGIPPEEWTRTEARGRELMARPDATVRDGRPSLARQPGTPLKP